MADNATHPPAQQEDLPRSLAGGRSPWLIAVIVSMATFMEVLDTAIANVSLTHIAGNLGATIDESTWVLTSYLVSNAIVLPISGWLANVFGRKRFYMGCVALFTLSSLCCGFATSLPMLIFFRVLQGIGGGGLAPSEQSILADSFTPEKRGMAFAVYGVAVVFAPTVGPVLGGWLTDQYSWHWIFLINVPVGVLSLVLTGIFLKEPALETKERKARKKKGFKVDALGFAFVVLGLGALQVMLDRGQQDDWFQSTLISSLLLISLGGLAALVFREFWLWRRGDEPIVDLPLLVTNRGFAFSCVVMFLLGFLLFGSTALLPQLTESLLGYTATQSGLVLAPGGIAVILAMPVVGILVSKVQPRNLVVFGLAIEVLALWLFSRTNPGVDYSHLMWIRVLQGSGLAFLFVPINSAAYIGLPENKTNEASALLNLARNLGGSFGISLAQAWISRRSQFHQSRIVETITNEDGLYRQTLDGLATNLGSIDRARRSVMDMVQHQAAYMSYLDVFYLMAAITLFAMPTAFLMNKLPKGEKPKSGH